MNDTLEKKLRDHLAANLWLIEDGLILTRVEYRLNNALGAKGWIDILARDRFGHVVIIELKRSDPSARTALHELNKYVALLQINEGTADDNIRCMVVSTDWHELLVPFSEFARRVPYQAEGYEMTLDKNNRMPERLSRVKLAPESSPLIFCPHHFISLYDSEDRRDQSLPHILKALDDSFVKDFVILDLRYKGQSPNPHIPHGHYIAIGSITGPLRDELLHKLTEEEVDYEAELEGDPIWWMEQQALARAVGDFCEYNDGGEAGYPQKMPSVLHGYQVTNTRRYGRFAAADHTLTGQDVIVALSGISDGTNPVAYGKFCSPQFEAEWSLVQERVQYCLKGNTPWSSAIAWYLKKLEAESRNATVSIRIHNPLNIVLSLYRYSPTRLQGLLPSLEVFVQETSGERRMLVGFVEWDRKTRPDDPAEAILRAFSNLSDFFFASHIGESWRYEEAFMSSHGFSYSTLELRIRPDKSRTACHIRDNAGTGGDLIDENDVRSVMGSLDDFIEANAEYVTKLAQLVDSHVRFVQ